MATTTVDTNNKLIRFTQDINREFVRQNMFSPYMSEGMDAIIRIRQELKAGGEDMNIPHVTRLQGQGVATGTLVGNEERIDNYGMRVRLEWAVDRPRALALVTSSPYLARLHTLDVSHANLGDAEAEVLVASDHADSLQRLLLQGNRFGTAGQQSLRERFGTRGLAGHDFFAEFVESFRRNPR